MGVDFSWLDEKNGEQFVSLNDRQFNQLEAPLSELLSKSGIVIDRYGRTRLSPDHARLILEVIDKDNLDVRESLPDFIKMLKIATEYSWWILVEGD